MFFYCHFFFNTTTNVTTEAATPYRRFKQLTAEGQIERVTLRADELSGELRGPTAIQPSDLPVSRITKRIPATGDPELLPLLEQHDVEIEVLPGNPSDVSQILLSNLPWAILIGVYL